MWDSRRIRATLLWTALVSCTPQAGTEPAWNIVPGRSAGAITPTSSEGDLVTAYGQAAVQPSRIELGEGETAPGTILFGPDSARRLEIIWKDTVARAQPARLVWRGSKSHWHLPSDISLGSSLREIEGKNGRPFTLAGFGWDYGGVVVDWAGGTLDSVLPGVRLYLDPGSAHYNSASYRRVLGDRDYSSADEHMRALNPTVYQIFMDFQ